MPRPSRRREGKWPFVLLALVLAGGVWAWIDAERRVALEVVGHERGALAALRRLGESQARHREQTGTYAGLAELGAAGLLEGLTLRSEGGETFGVASGYRLDLLLPTGPGVGPVLPLALPERVPPDPALAARHFAGVARPLEPGRSGFRTWYLDETGRVYVSEGLVDEEGLTENALPPLRVVRASDGKEPGMAWRALDDLQGQR